MSTPEGQNQPEQDHGFPPDLNTTEEHAYPFYKPPVPTLPPASAERCDKRTPAGCGRGVADRMVDDATTIYSDSGHRTRIVPQVPGESNRGEPAQETAWKFADDAMPDWLTNPGVPILITILVAVVAGVVGLIVVLATL